MPTFGSEVDAAYGMTQLTFRRIMSLVAMAFLWTASQIPVYMFGTAFPTSISRQSLTLLQGAFLLIFTGTPCTTPRSNSQLTIGPSDIGGTDRWIWFVRLPSVSQVICTPANTSQGPSQPSRPRSRMPFRRLPLRPHGPSLRRHPRRMPDHPRNDCRFNRAQHEHLYR